MTETVVWTECFLAEYINTNILDREAAGTLVRPYDNPDEVRRPRKDHQANPIACGIQMTYSLVS